MRSAALLLVWCACGGGARPPAGVPAPSVAAAPSAQDGVGLTPGESMAFEVKLAGVLAGEAQLAVGALGAYEGRPAVVVKSRAATAGAAALLRHVVDEATTVIDFQTGRPLALETNVEQGDRKTTATARFTDNVADITYRRSEEARPRTMRIDYARGAIGAVMVHDAHSAMAQLRGWRAATGTRRSVYVVGGRRVWRVDVTAAGEDTIGSAEGNRRAVKFTGASFRVKRDFTLETATPTRTFTVWLSDDADRVPLRVAASTELGDIVMELTAYDRGS
jgi:hypothetical protein